MGERPIAKVFGEGRDQIVCVRAMNSDGDPGIQMFFDPKVDGLGISSMTPGYDNEEDRDEQFDLLDEALALGMRDQMRAQLQQMRGG